jgi:hypothetical protein
VPQFPCARWGQKFSVCVCHGHRKPAGIICATVSPSVPPCPRLCHHVPVCATVSPSVPPCPRLCHHVPVSATVSPSVPPCPCLCHRVPACATVSPSLPPCPHLCHCVPVCATMDTGLSLSLELASLGPGSRWTLDAAESLGPGSEEDALFLVLCRWGN